MSAPELHVAVPGALDQRTGGYIYDARMVRGLRDLGWRIDVHSLDGQFPDADPRARRSLHRTLTEVPGGARIIVDGLAMGGLPEAVCAHAGRLRLMSLVHHPLADETGLAPPARERFARLEREALAACLGVVVTSQYTADRLGAFEVPSSRIRVVTPGTDPGRPAKGPGPDAAPRLLCVASVTPRKGQDVLVGALARLREMRWSCVMAGSLTLAPEYATAVRQQVRDAGLESRVEFPGECGSDALDELYDASSLFVLPSHYEGYGMALTEALARGLPIVSTTGGAIPHTIPADAAILVPPGDVSALANALGDLLSDELLSDESCVSADRATSGATRRATLASAASRHAALLPTWGRAAETFAAAILELTPDAE